MAKKSRRWTDDELVLAYEFYCRTPFGRLHHRNPDIIALADWLDRTPSALAMKLVNFASLDETQRSRGIRGLSNTSVGDRRIVEHFRANWTELAERAAAIRAKVEGLQSMTIEGEEVDSLTSFEVTEKETLVRVRVVQSFFRAAVLANYDESCAICGIRHRNLLTASHIIPWSQDESRRADPSNGICLCAIHDRAFDRGLIAVNAEMRIVIAKTLQENDAPKIYHAVFAAFDGHQLQLPLRFHPDPAALRHHFETFITSGQVQ